MLPSPAATGANSELSNTLTPYLPLPDKFSTASFEAGRSGDFDAMRLALDRFGFVVLREFIPRGLSMQAFIEATTVFLDVMRSFRFGLSIDNGTKGFDELAKLPSAVWERRPSKEVALPFESGSPGMTLHVGTLEVQQLVPGGQASRKGVQLGWKVIQVESGNDVCKPLHGGSKVCVDQRKSLAAMVHQGAFYKTKTIEGLVQEGVFLNITKITFKTPVDYTPLAASQKWGVSTSRGYQSKLGLGKSTDAVHFQKCPAVMNAQLWMRQPLAALHRVLPFDLCWQPDGVSFKAGDVSLSRGLTFALHAWGDFWTSPYEMMQLTSI
jgi:hypothetical protein